MSRKHNCKHQRSKSRYDRRLRNRGETSASVRMPTISRATAMKMLGYEGAPEAFSARCRKLVDDLPKMARRGRG